MTTPAVGTSVLPLSMAMGPPTQIHNHAILQACQLELDALSHASSLHEVVEQVEEGCVQQIRDKYGPRKGRLPNPLWENIKGTVNRQGRLYVQLETEFAGEREHFFDFFTHQPRDESAVSSKGKRKASGESLFPLCKVVDVISLILTKSSPNLGLPRSTSDHSDYSVHPRSPDLSPISGYSDYP